MESDTKIHVPVSTVGVKQIVALIQSFPTSSKTVLASHNQFNSLCNFYAETYIANTNAES